MRGTAAWVAWMMCVSLAAADGPVLTAHGADVSAAEWGHDFLDDSDFLGNQLLDRHRQPHWFAGTEFTFVDVAASSGGRVTLSFDDSGTAGTDIQIADGNGYDDLTFAPRMWLGRRFGERWGVVAHYWHMNGHSSQFPDLVPGTTPLSNFATFDEASSTEAYTIDIEGIRTFTPGPWTLDLAVGARHVSLSTTSKVSAFGVFTTGNFVNMALSNGSAFDGTGVTYSLTARRRIADTHAHLFVMGRGTRAEGQTDSFGRAVGSVASSPNAPLVGAATVRRNDADAVMDIGELQAGIQWERDLVCLPASFFFRTAYEYQYWNLTGRPTGGAGFAGTIGDLTTNSFASAGLGDMKLMGLAIGTGLTW